MISLNGNVVGTTIKGKLSIGQGTQGLQGEKGDQGEKGEKGDQGDNRVKVSNDTPIEGSVEIWFDTSDVVSGEEIATKDYVEATNKEINDRVNNIISNNGDGTKDAELIDARCGSPTLGEKIRGISSSLETIVSSVGYNLKNFKCSDGEYVKGDGIHDDTSGIQSAIDYIYKKGGGTIVIPNGTYMINAMIGLQLKSNVNIINQGGILKAIPNNSANYNVIFIGNNCFNNILSDLVIEGERNEHLGSSGEWGNGINIKGNCGNIIFHNLTISNCWGDGIETYRVRIGGSNYVDYIPSNLKFTGITKISNCRRQGITIGSGENIEIENLICKDINGVLPMAGLNIENEFSVDLVGDIRVNYLKTNGCSKAFTMRTKAPLTGNISIGTIESENQITELWGGFNTYIPQFRVIFEYFGTEHSMYSVNVDNIYAENQTVQLINVYKDYTPSINIGNIYTKKCNFINSANPYTRGIIVIDNTMYPNADEIITGNINIGKINVDTLNVLDLKATPIRPFIVTVPTEIIDKCYLDNFTIEYMNINNFGSFATKGYHLSNINFRNVNVNTCFKDVVYTRQDGGSKTIIVQDKNIDYVLNATTSNATKVIVLRMLDGVKEYTLKTNYNVNIKINTSYFNTKFDSVIFNDVSILNDGSGNYILGDFSGSLIFNMKAYNKQIIINSY